jgi:serine/threonine protein phosphatase PrpC
MRVSVCGRTDLGKRRSNNEDDLAMVDLTASFENRPPIDAEGVTVGDRGILLAVCDGVGGNKAGEIAAALALESLSHEMESLAGGCPRQTLFKAAVENVNLRVWQKGQAETRLRGMATTLTAAVICHRRAIIAHVGDSRAYVLRGGSIQQLTRDQSFCASMIACGALTEEQAESSPFRNTILQAIGRASTVDVALDGVDLENGDVLLLCTDGLSNKVSAEEMAGAFGSRSLCAAVQQLIDLANVRGGDDNITVEAARVED